MCRLYSIYSSFVCEERVSFFGRHPNSRAHPPCSAPPSSPSSPFPPAVNAYISPPPFIHSFSFIPFGRCGRFCVCVERKEISFIGNAMLTRHNLAQSGGEQQLYTHTKIFFFFFFSFIIFILFFLDREKRRKDERMNGTRREVLDDDAIKKRVGWRESHVLDTSESLQQIHISTQRKKERRRERSR